MTRDDDGLIFDWNEASRRAPPIPSGFTLMDETLRDGIQSPSVRNPDIGEKLELLYLMEGCGIEYADVGLPGAGPAAQRDVTRLVHEVRRQGLRIEPNCAARTHPADIQAVAEFALATGRPIEVCAFLGSSPVRRLVEGWDIVHMRGLVARAGELCRRTELPFSFVTEDTTRAHPETLRELFLTAIDHGATRLVLCDTVGHATPDGLVNLLAFTRGVVEETGADVKLDWHGHNDRGLSLTLALTALENGVDRVHGTCLGVGERVGNTSIDQLLINLHLLGVVDRDLRVLGAYVARVSETYQSAIPFDYPVFGRDAFRTATGVHAAAILKARQSGRPDLADRVYSSVPARAFGRQQTIDVGFYSGRANAIGWMLQHGLDPTPERAEAILAAAKEQRHVLSEQAIEEVLLRAAPREPQP